MMQHHKHWNWVKVNGNCMLLFGLGAFILGLFISNFLVGERIQFQNGLGWDGFLYADWARKGVVALIQNDELSLYSISRVLPSFIVQHLAAIFNYDITPDPNIIKAFYLYNCACLAGAFFLLVKIAKLKQWSGPTTLIAVAGIFFNYAVLKNASYNPTLTDMTALFFAVLTLYAWCRNSILLYCISSFFAFFVWPSFVYSLIPLLFFWNFNREKLADNSQDIFPPRTADLLAFGIAAGTIAVSLYLYYMREFRLPDGTNPVNSRVFWLTLPLYVSYLFLMLRNMTDPNYAIRALRAINYKYAALAIVLFIGIKVMIVSLSNGEPGPLKPLTYIALIAQGGMVNPLGNFVAHFSHYGPIIGLVAILLFRMQRTAKALNPGVAFSFLLYGYLSIGTESRQFLPFLPILVYFACIELNKLKPDWFFAWSFSIIALGLSRFWLQINVAPWTFKSLLEFPEQMLFMYTGPWMSDRMYMVFLMVTIITMVGIVALFRSLPTRAAAKIDDKPYD